VPLAVVHAARVRQGIFSAISKSRFSICSRRNVFRSITVRRPGQEQRNGWHAEMARGQAVAAHAV
jgi:hypothetical protein